MILFPAEWKQHFGEHLVTAYTPSGGRYRFYERLRPAPDFASIVERLLLTDPSFQVTQLGETVKLVTQEGEYGAWVRIQGIRDNRPAQHCIGAIFMEDFAAALDALSIVPATFGELALRSREFLHRSSFGLGRRRRLFYYTPPPGWQALMSGLVANWYPPDFPRNRANISVPPATPTTLFADDAIEERLASIGAGLEATESARETLPFATSLPGRCLRVSGKRAGDGQTIHRDLAAFAGEGYVYTMRLETMSPERIVGAREMFRVVLASFRPLTNPDERRVGQAFVRLPPLLNHWAD